LKPRCMHWFVCLNRGFYRRNRISDSSLTLCQFLKPFEMGKPKTAHQRYLEIGKEFPNSGLKSCAGKLKCSRCGIELNYSRKSIVVKHLHSEAHVKSGTKRNYNWITTCILTRINKWIILHSQFLLRQQVKIFNKRCRTSQIMTWFGKVS